MPAAKRLLYGYTLVELLITLTIIGITLALTGTLLRDNYARQKLKQAGWTLYSDIKYAQSLASAKNTNVYLNYQTGSNWCYGFSDASSCTCSTANSCQVNGVEKVVKAASFNNVTLTASGFSTTNLIFESSRGVTTTGTGNFIFSRGNFSIQVQENNSNRLILCSNNISGFPACS